MEERWSSERLNGIVGSPKEPIPGSGLRRVIASAKQSDETQQQELPAMIPHVAPGVVPRHLYIYKHDLDKFGATVNCPACAVIVKGSKYRAAHTAECRSRFEEALKQDERGAQRAQRTPESVIDGRMARSAVHTEVEEPQSAGGDAADRGLGPDQHMDISGDASASAQMVVVPGEPAGSGQVDAEKSKSIGDQNDRELKWAVTDSIKEAGKRAGKHAGARSDATKRRVEAPASGDDDAVKPFGEQSVVVNDDKAWNFVPPPDDKPDDNAMVSLLIRGPRCIRPILKTFESVVG